MWMGETSALLLGAALGESATPGCHLTIPLLVNRREDYAKPSTSLTFQGRSHLLGRAPGSHCRAFWLFRAAWTPPHPSTPSVPGAFHTFSPRFPRRLLPQPPRAQSFIIAAPVFSLSPLSLSYVPRCFRHLRSKCGGRHFEQRYSND